MDAFRAAKTLLLLLEDPVPRATLIFLLRGCFGGWSLVAPAPKTEPERSVRTFTLRFLRSLIMKDNLLV